VAPPLVGARAALRLLDDERRYLNWLAFAAAVAFVLLYRPWLSDDQRSRLLLAGFGVTFAAALWALGRLHHRLWAAFGAFLVGLFAPWGFAYVFGSVYVAFAFWLVWRAHRASRSGLTETGTGTSTGTGAEAEKRPRPI
jgi:hypothetical protein